MRINVFQPFSDAQVTHYLQLKSDKAWLWYMAIKYPQGATDWATCALFETFKAKKQ